MIDKKILIIFIFCILLAIGLALVIGNELSKKKIKEIQENNSYFEGKIDNITQKINEINVTSLTPEELYYKNLALLKELNITIYDRTNYWKAYCKKYGCGSSSGSSGATSGY